VTFRASIQPPDAREIYAIHEERDAGLSPSQIGVRHNLPPVAIQQFFRPRPNTTLPTPFELTKSQKSPSLAIPLYWLGFITASGRVYFRSDQRTVVLSLDSGDLEFAQLMVRDLLRTHASYELCLSSHDGHQAYIRDRDMGEALLHWGVTTDPRETGLPVDYIPGVMLAHFLRGLVEGQVHFPPFGGRNGGVNPSARVQRVTIPGSRGFTEALRQRLEAASRAMRGQVEPSDSEETGVLVYHGTAARALLHFAYHHPLRSSPRAEGLARTFTSPGSRLQPADS